MHSEVATWKCLVVGFGSIVLATPIDDDNCRHYRYPKRTRGTPRLIPGLQA